MDSAMSEWARSSLLVNRLRIIDDLNVDYVINYLMQDRVIDIDESEIIQHEITSRKKAAKMLDILGRKNQTAYFSFYNALRDNYPELAELLEEDIPEEELDAALSPPRSRSYSIASVQSLLMDGGVPPKPPNFINRPMELAMIRNTLWKLKDYPGWVVVHGMGGCGKTVLAAEAVRDAELIADCFPGGVFWAHIGQIDKHLALMKLQNLCTRLDKERRTPPQNIEEARDRLRTILLHQHPKSLLILDDVWRPEVAKAFDNQARVLLTTRDATVTDLVSGHVFKVPLTKGFNEDESKELLAKYTGEKNIDELPDEATEIFKESNGLPLCVSMIGALLKDHPTRWQYYLDKLKTRQTKRVRKRSNYEYDTLDEAINMSVTNLSDEMKELYNDFALFDESVRVPAPVLCILWDKEVEDVEDDMLEFVNKSLAIQDYDNTNRYYKYSVHNLQLDVLKESTKEQTETLHRKLVEQYHKSCGGDFHKIKNDNYIHWYLARHMIQANMRKELWDLLLDIKWVESKIRITGPSDLLAEYIKYVDTVEPEREEDREDFLSFVSMNVHYFMEKPSYDLTQLALCQHADTEVYRQALKRAQDNSDKFYVDWSNKESFIYSCLLTNKGHESAVKCAQFSPNGSKVVSCSSDKTVKVWDSHSGQEYLSMTGHTDFVNWCCYSPNGTMIASCSDDKTVRIWNSRDGGLIHTFRVHEEEVNMCSWSHDSTRVVSCSNDWYIRIWDVVKASLITEIAGHDDAVRACHFSPDDDYLISCSQDCTVKVWDISSDKWVVHYRGHNSTVSSCCFSPDGKNVASSSEHFVQIWIAHTGQLLNTCESKSGMLVLDCVYSPDGTQIAAGLSDFSIQIWDSTSTNTLALFKGHSGWVYVVDFDSTGKRLLSGADDGTTMIWDVESGQNQDMVGLKRDFAAVYTAEDNILVVAPDLTNRIRITQGHNGDAKLHRSCSTMTPSEDCRIRCCTISPTDQIAYGTDKGQVKVLSLGGQVMYDCLHGHNGPVRSMCYTQDGKVLITCSDDKTVKIWKDSAEAIVCTGHTQSVRKCILFNKDTKILSSSYDGTLKVWDARTGQLIYTCLTSKEWVLSCDISHDESMIASTSVDRTAKIWNSENGELIHNITGHRDCVRSCKFSSDSKLLATGDDQGIVKIWNTKTGKLVSSCGRHHCWVTDIKWSLDSKRLVSVSENIKWWTVNGTCLQTLPIKGSFSKYIEVLDDYKTFVTIDSAGILYILTAIDNTSAKINGAK
ncbi:apoptotic protease-activating factor 1-like [Glandiceps talaboti]